MDKYFIIDRFEEDFAVLETPKETIQEVKRSDLPIDAKEGDYLLYCDTKWSIDHEATKVAREKIIARLAQLKK